MANEVGVDYRRFRPNIYVQGVEGRTERTWVARGLRIGTALIGVRQARSRCLMTTFNPDTLEQDARVLRRIISEFDGQVALDCWVVEPGVVSIGDVVEVVDLDETVDRP